MLYIFIIVYYMIVLKIVVLFVGVIKFLGKKMKINMFDVKLSVVVI